MYMTVGHVVRRIVRGVWGKMGVLWGGKPHLNEGVLGTCWRAGWGLLGDFLGACLGRIVSMLEGFWECIGDALGALGARQQFLAVYLDVRGIPYTIVFLVFFTFSINVLCK